MSAKPTRHRSTRPAAAMQSLPPAAVTLLELAYLAGTRREVIEEMLEFELIEPCLREPELCFPVDVLPRVRKLMRLSITLDVDFSALPLLLDLLARIDQLERRLTELARR